MCSKFPVKRTDLRRWTKQNKNFKMKITIQQYTLTFIQSLYCTKCSTWIIYNVYERHYRARYGAMCLWSQHLGSWGRRITTSSRLAWTTSWVQDQPEPYGKTLFISKDVEAENTLPKLLYKLLFTVAVQNSDWNTCGSS